MSDLASLDGGNSPADQRLEHVAEDLRRIRAALEGREIDRFAR